MKRIAGLDVMIWNARGLNSKKEELQRHIQDYDINIITEIKIGTNDTFNVTRYRSIVKNRINDIGRGIGRVAIFIKNNIVVEEIRNMDVDEEELDCVGIRIKNIEEWEEVAMIGI